MIACLIILRIRNYTICNIFQQISRTIPIFYHNNSSQLMLSWHFSFKLMFTLKFFEELLWWWILNTEVLKLCHNSSNYQSRTFWIFIYLLELLRRQQSSHHRLKNGNFPSCERKVILWKCIILSAWEAKQEVRNLLYSI